MRSFALRVTDSSKIAEARRMSAQCAQSLVWNEEDSGRAALVATELASNLVKHAQTGAITFNALNDAAGARLQIVSTDHGPGMADVERCMSDGYSTAGSPGTGLGAIRRIAETFDVFSTRGKGTVAVAEMRERTGGVRRAGFAAGGVCIPRQGEQENGDGWAYVENANGLSLIVCDGLGHGPAAAHASQQVLAAFRVDPWAAPEEIVRRIHDATRSTRGAAVSVAQVDRARNSLLYCGIGNISGAVVQGLDARRLVSHNGIVGHTATRIASFSYGWTQGCSLLLHSDGISGRWRTDEWPGLWQRNPALIAGTLYRDWSRGSDDSTAVIVRAL